MNSKKFDFKILDIVTVNSFCPYKHLYIFKTYLILKINDVKSVATVIDCDKGLNVQDIPLPYLDLVKRL